MRNNRILALVTLNACFLALIISLVSCNDDEKLQELVSLDVAKSAARYFAKENWGSSQLLYIRRLTDANNVPQAYLAVFQFGKGEPDSIEKITCEVEKIKKSGNINDAFLTERFGTIFVGGRYGVNPYIASRKGLPYLLVLLEEAEALVCPECDAKPEVNRWLYWNLTEIAEFVVKNDTVYVDMMRMKTISPNMLHEGHSRKSKKSLKKWEKLLSLMKQ